MAAGPVLTRADIVRIEIPQCSEHLTDRPASAANAFTGCTQSDIS